MARPSSYKPEYAKQGFKLCLLGATDKQLADFFGVAESTINKWKLDFPEFSESLKLGKQEADAQVANSLYQRALGYSHPEEKIVTGAHFEDGYARVDTVKQYAPDTTAAIFWLKNRAPEEWRDVKQHEHTVAELSDQERVERISRILLQRTADGDRQTPTH